MAKNGATMKKLLVLTLGLALGAGTITPVFATPIPRCIDNNGVQKCLADITIGGQTFHAPVVVDPATGQGNVQNFTARIGATSVTIQSLAFDPDPSIIFSVSATNNTAVPLLVTMAFTEPINLSGTINAASSIGYTLTSVAKAVTLTALPDANPNTCTGGACVLTAYDISATNILTNKGVDVGPSVTGGVGTCGAFVGFTSNCGPYAASNTFTGGPFVAMEVLITFSLSGNSSAGLSGAVTQDLAVPEPATLLLMGSGLLGLAGWRRYSSRA
jgi:hypothetical protein